MRFDSTSPTRTIRTGLLALLAILLLALPLAVGGNRFARSNVVAAGPARLLFDDRFHGSEPDDNRWNYCFWWGADGCTIASNEELQWYVKDQVVVRDGVLRLVADHVDARQRDDDRSDLPYRSGMISTGRASNDKASDPKFAFRYGYLEVVAKVPRCKGLWPALWLLPVTNRSKPEIDILEVRGSETSKASFHLHYGTSERPKSLGQDWSGVDLANDWHTFSLDWQPRSLTWFIDGVEVWRVTGRRVPDESMYLIANLAVGGEYPGSPDANTEFPASFELDRVSVWSQRP